MDAVKKQLESQYPDLRTEISDDIFDPQWDSFLDAAPGASHLQTSLWAQVKQPFGWRCARILLMNADSIIAGAQLLIRDTRFGAIAYLPKGPVVTNDHDLELIYFINSKLLEIAKEERILTLLIQPPNNGQTIERLLVSRGFQKSTVSLAPDSSALINLDNEPDDILAGMKKRTRHNLRLGERQGIIVEEGSEKDLKEFYDLYCKTVKRHDGVPEPYSYLHHMWRTFAPSGHIKLFLAKLNEQTLAGKLLIAFNDTVICKRTGWSGVRKLRPNELLHWTAMKWAKSQGYSLYDFEGVDRRAVDAILAGQKNPDFLNNTPTSFKLGFGCKVVVYPDTYMYILNPFLRWVFNRLVSRLFSRGQLWNMTKALRGN